MENNQELEDKRIMKMISREAQDLSHFSGMTQRQNYFYMYTNKKSCKYKKNKKTYKLLWKYIAKEMEYNGYSVTPLQVEN